MSEVRGVHARTRAVRARWTPSLVRRWASNRVVVAAFAGGLIILGSVWLQAQTQELERARASWGETQSVVVVVESVAIGESVAGSVELRDVPAAIVPKSAIRGGGQWDESSTSLAKVPLEEGEILLASRVTETSKPQLPSGTVAVSVTMVEVVPLIGIGDFVDLYAIDSANLSSVRVGHNVLVLAIGDDVLTVAVPTSQVGDVAAASLRPLTIALVG